MKKLRQSAIKYLPFATIAVAAILICSLIFGWLNVFSPGVQGYGYFSAPKSFVNLLIRHSAYNSWCYPPYDGGQAYSIYLAHPAFSVFVASWFSYFSPWTSYWLFALFSLGLMLYCGRLIAGTTDDPLKKQLSYFILICSIPVYVILYSGNIHAVFVLGITLVFIGVYDLTYSLDLRRANTELLTGLLISLLTKPVALLMLPLLILTKETRVTSLKAFGIYAAVSALFIVVPFLNPEGIGLARLAHVAFDFNFIRQNMNIFQNNLVITEYMKDNSFHWLNLIAQSDYRLMGSNIFSFPAFLDTLVGRRLPNIIYQIPLLAGLGFSVIIPFVREKQKRMEACLFLLFALSVLYLICYNTVWEHQFASLLPVVALLPVLSDRGVFYKRYIPAMFSLGAVVSLPTLIFLFGQSDLNNTAALTLIRLDKIVPVYLLFWAMIFQIIPVAKAVFSRSGASRSVTEIAA